MSQTVHCHISGLLQLDSITSGSNEPFLNCTASIHGVCLNVADDLSIPVKLTYFNIAREQFSNGAVVFCSGALLIAESFDDHPELSIRAHYLIRFATECVFFFSGCFADLHQVFR